MKKRILSEGRVRRMMKLANIGALTENFIEETEELEENGDETGDYTESLDEQEEEEGVFGLEGPEGEPGDETVDLGGEEEDIDLGGEEEPGEEDVDADDLSDFLEFINDKVEDYAEMKGIDLEVEFEEEGEEGEEEFPEEPEMEEPEMEEPEEEPFPEEEPGEEAMMSESLRREIESSLDAAGIFIEEDIEANLINEVTRRVANRLLVARARKK